jgi:transglycosylase-like protein with SLT domain
MAVSRQDVQEFIWKTAIEMGIDPTLATRLAHQESRFNPEARSPVGAIGVMQLMPGTAKDLGVDPYDWHENVKGGLTYLKQQLQRFGGDARLALAAYNAGPGAVQKYGDVPPYKETQHYVQTILAGQGPPTAMTASRQGTPSRDWGQELGFTAQATPEPGAEPPIAIDQGRAGDVSVPGQDWAQVLFGETASAEAVSPGAGQDWVSLLFG